MKIFGRHESVHRITNMIFDPKHSIKTNICY